MTLLRGRGMGLEVVLSGREFTTAIEELAARLTERPDFYRGTTATAVFGSQRPSAAEIAELRRVLGAGGIELRALSGDETLAEAAIAAGLTYVSAPAAAEEFARRRALRPKREVNLSESARSLVADFAGARADIAERRKRGEGSVRRHVNAPKTETAPLPPGALPNAGPETLYHVGTLRGGQALHHQGTIVVVGDVNPGTELVATGDIVVFGRLRGVAHAGAQGALDARIYALDLDATQLRIATTIAADDGDRKRSPVAEAAVVRDGRIVIVPFEKLGEAVS